MSFNTKTACHENTKDYQECLEGAFNVSSQGIDQAGDYQILLLTLTLTIITISAGWMLMSIYNSWVSGSFKFNELIVRSVRVLVITSILSYFVVG